ncbi:MAG: hypothetical protein GX595_07495 [Lentisphaerae bacterium]|nr:hypothetical protein [Lentisphaerota bacterium]
MGYWSFDEPEQEGLILAEDKTGNGHQLSESLRFRDCHTIGEGRVGDGLVSTGTDDAISALRSVSADFNLRFAFTVEMWIRKPRGSHAAMPPKRSMYLFSIDKALRDPRGNPFPG